MRVLEELYQRFEARVASGDLPAWARQVVVDSSPRKAETVVLEAALHRATAGRLRWKFVIPVHGSQTRHPVEDDLDLLVALGESLRRGDREVVVASPDSADILVRALFAVPVSSSSLALTDTGLAFADLHSGWRAGRAEAERLRAWAEGADDDVEPLSSAGLLESWCGQVRASTAGLVLVHRERVSLSKRARRRLPTVAMRDRVEVVHGFTRKTCRLAHEIVRDQEDLLERPVHVGEVFEEAVRRELGLSA